MPTGVYVRTAAMRSNIGKARLGKKYPQSSLADRPHDVGTIGPDYLATMEAFHAWCDRKNRNFRVELTRLLTEAMKPKVVSDERKGK